MLHVNCRQLSKFFLQCLKNQMAQLVGTLKKEKKKTKIPSLFLCIHAKMSACFESISAWFGIGQKPISPGEKQNDSPMKSILIRLKRAQILDIAGIKSQIKGKLVDTIQSDDRTDLVSIVPALKSGQRERLYSPVEPWFILDINLSNPLDQKLHTLFGKLHLFSYVDVLAQSLCSMHSDYQILVELILEKVEQVFFSSGQIQFVGPLGHLVNQYSSHKSIACQILPIENSFQLLSEFSPFDQIKIRFFLKHSNGKMFQDMPCKSVSKDMKTIKLKQIVHELPHEFSHNSRHLFMIYNNSHLFHMINTGLFFSDRKISIWDMQGSYSSLDGEYCIYLISRLDKYLAILRIKGEINSNLCKGCDILPENTTHKGKTDCSRFLIFPSSPMSPTIIQSRPREAYANHLLTS
ncbi:hypothetical protein VP01_349g6 [Puccinia sorghi]|uniref:Uncharacterized protein n=1 Tax=Puccinia sorghi TaxID=27349 RepID=A0A0L6UVP4_9BASI|nr:hypothetical protein VP01_349g6 [Puccinia sorghi]